MTGQAIFAGIGKFAPAPSELDNNKAVNGLFRLLLLADAAPVAAFLCPLLVPPIVSTKYECDWSVFRIETRFF